MQSNIDRKERISPYALAKLREYAADNNRGKIKDIPYYSNLMHTLDQCGLTYADFFNLIGTPLHWLDERTESVAKKLEEISSIDRFYARRIARFSKTMLPELFQRTDLWSNVSPSIRIALWRGYVMDFGENKRLVQENREKLPDYFSVTPLRSRVTTEKLLFIIDLFKLPYHWVLCTPPNTAILASSGEIESVMDDFVRLPEKSKKFLETMIDKKLGTLQSL